MSIGNKNKSDLNLYCQKAHIPIATYTSELKEGNFHSTVTVKDTHYPSTSGYPTKKEAENDAAGVALISILQKQFGGQTFDDVIALLELRFPSKNKKKSKQAAASLVEVMPRKVEGRVEVDSATAQTRPTHTQQQPQVVAAFPSQQSVALDHQAVVTSRTVIGQGPSHPQQGYLVTGGGVDSIVTSQTPVAYPKGRISVGGATNVNQCSGTMSANFCHPGGPTTPTQSPAAPWVAAYAHAPPAVMYSQMPQGQVQTNVAPYVYYGVPGHSQAPPLNPPHIFQSSPQRGMHSPRPSMSSTVGPVHVTPPPGLQNVQMAARFPVAPPSTSSPPPPPPGFSPRQPIATTQLLPSKPLNAIPVSHDRHGFPTSASSSYNSQDPSTVVQSSPPSWIPQVDHPKALEALCSRLKLSVPMYQIKEEGNGNFWAEVKVGDKTYQTRWKCDDFDQAKMMAAMEALSQLALTSMDVQRVDNSGTDKQQKPEQSSCSPTNISTRETHPNTSQSASSTSSSSTPPATTARVHSTTATQSQPPNQVKHTEQVSSNLPKLHPPSFFVQTQSSHQPPTSTQSEPKPSAPVMAAQNYKQVLNIHCQKNHIPLAYECSSSDDSVGYIATVRISGREFKSIPHGTKKAAETAAAEVAVKALGLGEGSSVGQPHQQWSGNSAHTSGNHHTSSHAAHSQNVSVVSYKNLLQEHVQKLGLSLPHYETERAELGFKSTVRVQQVDSESLLFTSSPQPVKKAAEQEAAKLACIELQLV